MHSKTYLHTISEMLQRSKKFTLPPPIKENDVKPKEQKSRNFSVFKGLFLAMISGIFYSIAAVVVKKMNNMHTGQLAVYRFIAILVFSMPSAVKSQENLFGPKDLRFLLILRGIFGATNLFLNFMAFRYLPLGEAAVIIFSVPVFVTVAARIFLKEPCGIFQSVTVLLTVIGILLTTKIPLKLASNSLPYTSNSLYGIVAAIVSLLFSTLRFIVIRKVKRVHHSIIMVNNGWVALLESLILTTIVGNFKWHDCGYEGLFIIILGLVSYIGQTLLTVSLQCEMAGPVSTMRAAADIVLAFVWQIILFHDIPDALSLTGAVLVGFSVIFVGLKKWATSLPPESRLFIIVLGLVSYIGQTLLTVSLQCEMAGPVSTMRAAADIVLAFVWQIILFHDIPNALSLTGAVLVGFSVIFVSLKKWATSLPPESTQLRYVGWMTR